MNDNEIESVKLALKYGLRVLWQPDKCTARQVKSISARFDEDKVREDCEGFLCANFANGEYAALYNSDINDFVVAIDIETALGIVP